MLVPYSILISFICAAMNHLGLVAAAEKALHCKLPILNCPKCATFWLSLVFGIIVCGYTGIAGLVRTVAVAFAAAYLAVWIELLMGGVDKLYLMLYGKIYSAAAGVTADTPAAEREESSDTDGGSSSANAVPEVRG